MRKILKSIMDKYGDNDHSLSAKCGVPQPTINRFLTGKHGEPRESTVKKIASAYSLTSSQLRGDVPISFLNEDSKTAIETESNNYENASLIKQQMIQMILKADEKKLTVEKLPLFEMTIEADTKDVPTLSTVTYALNHPHQAYNSKPRRKKKQISE